MSATCQSLLREMNTLRGLFIYFIIIFFSFLSFLPLGVEQKRVCWFINIRSLAERGKPISHLALKAPAATLLWRWGTEAAGLGSVPFCAPGLSLVVPR